MATTPTAVVALLLLGSASTACADVVADSVVVELVRRPGSKAVRGHSCGAAAQRRILGRAGLSCMPCRETRAACFKAVEALLARVSPPSRAVPTYLACREQRGLCRACVGPRPLPAASPAPTSGKQAGDDAEMRRLAFGLQQQRRQQ